MKNWKKAVSLTAAAAMVMATMAPVSVFAEDETFKIGVIGPMTGDYAQYGTNVYNATKIAVDEINANGGFNGYQVEVLDAGDDQGDPEKAVNAYNDLLDKGMQMLCGTVTSGSCIAVCCISFICNNLKSVLTSCFYKSIMNTGIIICS